MITVISLAGRSARAWPTSQAQVRTMKSHIDESVDRRIEAHYPDVQEGDVVAVTYTWNYDGDRTTRTAEVTERSDHSFRIDAGDDEKSTQVAIRASAAGKTEHVRITSALKPSDDYRHHRHLSELNARCGRDIDDVDIEVIERADD
jgi:hypothetical protein